MKIRIECSRGFAGIPLFNEMYTKELPLSFVHTAKKIRDPRDIIGTYEVPFQWLCGSLHLQNFNPRWNKDEGYRM